MSSAKPLNLDYFKILLFCTRLNCLTLPNDKIFDWTKLKALADYKLDIKIIISIYDRIENIVGKGQNAGFQHFLLFPQCFQKFSFSGSLKVGIVW